VVDAAVQWLTEHDSLDPREVAEAAAQAAAGLGADEAELRPPSGQANCAPAPGSI
jgi:hypothetical protein